VAVGPPLGAAAESVVAEWSWIINYVILIINHLIFGLVFDLFIVISQ
jgi:hypothetical protein